MKKSKKQFNIEMQKKSFFQNKNSIDEDKKEREERIHFFFNERSDAEDSSEEMVR